jgi:hypothetical protein
LAKLYAGIVLLGIVTSSGRIGVVDGASMLNVARSIVHERTFAASPCAIEKQGNVCVPGIDGRRYAGFGLLSSVLAAPAVIAADGLGKFLHRDPYFITTFLVNITTLMVGALIPIVCVLWLTRMGYSWRASVITGLLLFFGTVLWQESVKGLYSEPFFALALVTSAYLLYISRDNRSLLLAGFIFGSSVGFRVVGAIFGPILAAYCFSLVGFEQWRNGLRRTIVFCLGVIPPLIWVAWTNYIRFGSIAKTGYHLAYPTASYLLSNPLLTGLKEIFFDGEVGILWYTPWILLLALAVPRFYKSHFLECMLLLAISVTAVLFFAKYISWNGGWSYGPRLLMPCLPFAVLPLVTLFEGWQAIAIGTRIAVATLIGASIFVHASGMPYPTERYYQVENYYSFNHQPPPWHNSILIAQWEELPMLTKSTLSAGSRVVAEAPPTTGLSGPSERARAATMTETQFLASFPNPINLFYPDLWLVKAVKLGVRALAIIPLALLLLGGGLALVLESLRLRDPIADPRGSYGDWLTTDRSSALP